VQQAPAGTGTSGWGVPVNCGPGRLTPFRDICLVCLADKLWLKVLIYYKKNIIY